LSRVSAAVDTAATHRLRESEELMDESWRWDAVETAGRIASGEVSAPEMVEAAIARAELWQRRASPLAATTYDEARREAGSARAGPFAGVPSAIKDLDDVAGVPTGMGSRAFDDFTPTATSATARQFLSLGFISIGKSTTSEFGLTCTTEPPGRTPTRNPRALQTSSGGSSGGAAALAAAGVVPLAYASDGGGSIRIPAANCGLVGLKPSRGRLAPIERAEMMPVKISTYGVVTRTVRDTAAYYAGVEAAEGVAPGLAPVGHVEGPSSKRLRIGLLVESPIGTAVHPDVRAAVLETGRALERLGHRVEEVSPLTAREAATFARDFFNYWALLAAAVERDTKRRYGRDYHEGLLEPWTRGLARHFWPRALWTPGGLLRLRRFARKYASMFDTMDVLVTPTVAAPAPDIGFLAPDQPFATKAERIKTFAAFTPLQNVSGAPAVSLPMGRTADGLPIGVQLANKLGGERTLLELAFELEAERPWPGAVGHPPA
jgi:amidase